MEHDDSRRRQDNQSQHDRSRSGNDRDGRQFSDERFGSARPSRERYDELQESAGRRNFGSHERDYGGSDDPYHARDRDYGEQRPGRGAGGGWRGDQNRTTTAEQRARGFTPRDVREDYRGGPERDFDSRYPYSGGSQSRDTEHERDQPHYRGYYSREYTPLAYQGGSGHLFTESWTFVGPFTGRGPKGWKRSDQNLVDEASQRLERDGDVDATDIEVLADGSVITLRGTVPDRTTKRRAEEAVESIYGVRDVMNELRVAPPAEDQRSPSSQQTTPRKARGSQTSQTSQPSPPSPPSGAAARSSGGSTASPDASAEDKSTH